jgi:hypothetical protein
MRNYFFTNKKQAQNKMEGESLQQTSSLTLKRKQSTIEENQVTKTQKIEGKEEEKIIIREDREDEDEEKRKGMYLPKTKEEMLKCLEKDLEMPLGLLFDYIDDKEVSTMLTEKYKFTLKKSPLTTKEEDGEEGEKEKKHEMKKKRKEIYIPKTKKEALEYLEMDLEIPTSTLFKYVDDEEFYARILMKYEISLEGASSKMTHSMVVCESAIKKDYRNFKYVSSAIYQDFIEKLFENSEYCYDTLVFYIVEYMKRGFNPKTTIILMLNILNYKGVANTDGIIRKFLLAIVDTYGNSTHGIILYNSLSSYILITYPEALLPIFEISQYNGNEQFYSKFLLILGIGCMESEEAKEYLKEENMTMENISDETIELLGSYDVLVVYLYCLFDKNGPEEIYKCIDYIDKALRTPKKAPHTMYVGILSSVLSLEEADKTKYHYFTSMLFFLERIHTHYQSYLKLHLSQMVKESPGYQIDSKFEKLDIIAKEMLNCLSPAVVIKNEEAE